MVDLDEKKVTVVAAEMAGGPHLALAIDLRPIANHARLFEVVTAAFGGLDVLVCTAAVLVRRDSVDEVSEADWDGVGETWFDSIAAADRAFATDPFREMLQADRQKFIGSAHSCYIEEQEVFRP